MQYQRTAREGWLSLSMYKVILSEDVEVAMVQKGMATYYEGIDSNWPTD